MNKFCFVAIMLYAIQHNMVDCPVVDVIDKIDRYRENKSRVSFLVLAFINALDEHDSRNVSFGVYDKYFDNSQFIERILPF